MKLNPLVLLTAVACAAAGLALTFAPDEVLGALGGGGDPVAVWVGRLLGAALLALAMLNWIQRRAVVAGILGRPLLLTNLLFTTVSFWASVDTWRARPVPALLVVTVVLGAFALAYGIRLFNPTPAAPKADR
ncbi:MAG TPA: hypothetical protein VK610_08585 [Rhodothermales bacterium]|nr:hypothetical protein [Rhodothermales bacterium]